MIYVLPFGFFIIAFALVYEMIVPLQGNIRGLVQVLSQIKK